MYPVSSIVDGAMSVHSRPVADSQSFQVRSMDTGRKMSIRRSFNAHALKISPDCHLGSTNKLVKHIVLQSFTWRHMVHQHKHMCHELH